MSLGSGNFRIVTIWRNDVVQNLPGVLVNTTTPAATNATTNLSMGGQFTIPANTLRVGSLYQITCNYVYLHTAAATPTITAELLINGTVIAQCTLVLTPISTASTFTGTIVYYVRCQALGSGTTGKVVCTADQKNSFVAFARPSIENPTGTATTDIDTTIARTLEGRIRMTTAVASNTLTVTQGFIEKVS